MKPAPFTYVRAESAEHVAAVLAEHGDEAKVLAGGQSLMPLLNMRLARPALLVDLNGITELDRIALTDTHLSVGAMARQTQLGASADVRSHAPLVAACVPYIGHFVTRNRGTVGGSIAHADARAELPVVLCALDGSVVVRSSGGAREIPAQELFVTHFTSALQADELLVETRLPLARPGDGFAFEEFAQRHGDYALGMVAVVLRAQGDRVADARVVVGATGDRPLLVEEASQLLAGSTPDPAVCGEVAATVAAGIEPLEDLHASASYRRQLVRVLTERALLRAWGDATEGER